jgi:hypothetical protein
MPRLYTCYGDHLQACPTSHENNHMTFAIIELKMYNRTSIKKLLSYLFLAFTTTTIVFKLQNSKKISDLGDYLN